MVGLVAITLYTLKGAVNYTDREKAGSTWCETGSSRPRRLRHAHFLGLRPCDIQQSIGHRVVEWQLAHDFADFFIDVLIQALRFVRRHAFRHFIEEAQAQV